MAFNPYPSDETEITLDWLNGALAESAHPAAGKIFACEASKLDTEGNTGWYALAQIESEPGSGLPDELFFKVATAYDLAITSQYENYSTEIAFYRDIVPGTPGRFLQFIYGKAGKPLFMSGPGDGAMRCQQILDTLEARCGPDGYHYVMRLSESHGQFLADDDVLHPIDSLDRDEW